ncbi:MAG: peroxiredoxin family protein [Bacteroidota bacterium]
MIRAKALFISAFILMVLLSAVYIAYQLYTDGGTLIWWSNALTVGMILLYFGWILLLDVPRTSRHMIWISLPALLGTIGVNYAMFQGQGPPMALYMNLGLLLGLLIYTYWATELTGRDNNFLQVGKAMPDAVLANVEGERVLLSSFFQQPTIFLFYRGNWCPFCMGQIKELAAQYRTITQHGAQLVFISPQSSSHTKSLALQLNVPAHFLLDESLEVAKKLKVFNEKGTPFGLELLGYTRDNVLPTLIITDAQGIIQFADFTDNYRVRPEPETYLKILHKIG